MIKIEINRRIRKFLKDRGITARHVATRTGINEKKLSRMLRGTQRIDLSEYGLICKVLQVDPNYFYDENFLESRNETA